MSHEAALTRMRDALSATGGDMCLVLEDDSVLAPDVAAARFHAVLKHALQQLSVRFPGWGLLQLGGAPVRLWAHNTRHKRIGITGLRCGESVYLAHAYLVRSHAIEALLARLSKGMTADGALVSYQRACNSRGSYKAFWCDPPLLSQNRALDSDIAQLPGTSVPASWDTLLSRARSGKLTKATSDTKARRKKSSTRSKRIQPARVKDIRQKCGRAGGSAQAGSGSTAKTIRAKERWMTKERDALGHWPAWKTCWRRKQISWNLYRRITTAN